MKRAPCPVAAQVTGALHVVAERLHREPCQRLEPLFDSLEVAPTYRYEALKRLRGLYEQQGRALTLKRGIVTLT